MIDTPSPSAVLQRRPYRWICLLLVAVALVSCGVPRPQRVILITLDTLRWDSLDEGDMPRLSAWAERATVFDRCYSASASTQPSHASIFTGLHPWEHGISRNGMVLGEEFELVSERLRDAGFTTDAVVASFPVSAKFGFDQGFGTFDDDFEDGTVRGKDWTPTVEVPDRASTRFYSLAATVTDRALARLEAATGDRQFFWFHFFDPHSPYGETTGEDSLTPGAVLSRASRGEDVTKLVARARALYDRDVAFLDLHLARLLDGVNETSDSYDTHVVVVADHGESFGEGGSMAHGRRLIPSQLHVPLVIRSPRLEPGRRAEVVGSIDLAPTLLALAGLDVVGDDRVESARSLLDTKDEPGRAFGMRRTYEEPFPDRRLDGSVVEIDGLLFYGVSPGGELVRGNRSRVDLYPTAHAPLSEGDRRSWRRLFASFETRLETDSVDLGDREDVREVLEALGYVN